MVMVYPSLTQARRMANIGLMAPGNAHRDRVLEVSPYGRSYVEAADMCVAGASQLESAVMDGVEVTDAQYGYLKSTGVL